MLGSWEVGKWEVGEWEVGEFGSWDDLNWKNLSATPQAHRRGGLEDFKNLSAVADWKIELQRLIGIWR